VGGVRDPGEAIHWPEYRRLFGSFEEMAAILIGNLDAGLTDEDTR